MFTQNEKVSLKHGDFTVFDLTTGGPARVHSSTLKNRKGIAWDYQPFTVRFTPIAGHAYLLWLMQTITLAQGNIRIQKVTHSFTLPPATGGSVVSVDFDASQRQAKLIEGTEFKANFPLVGPFPTLAPGVQLYRVSTGGLPSNGSDGVLDGLTPLLHDPKRTALVTVNSIPRWTN